MQRAVATASGSIIDACLAGVLSALLAEGYGMGRDASGEGGWARRGGAHQARVAALVDGAEGRGGLRTIRKLPLGFRTI